MDFIYILLCNLLVPVIILLSGIFMYKFPPEKVNFLVGYRTARSLKNADTWAFANKYCGKLWIKLGIILSVVSAAVSVPFIGLNKETAETAEMIIVIAQCVIMIGSIFPVEAALKRTFDSNGKRK